MWSKNILIKILMTKNWFLLNLIQFIDLNIDCSMFFNWRASRLICILRFTKWTTSMSNWTRIWVVFTSWNEYHEMRFFVNRSIKLSCWDLLLSSWFARWESEHNRWIERFDWSKISWDYRASLLDLKETVRWLGVTYSYSGRGRNNNIEDAQFDLETWERDEMRYRWCLNSSNKIW
jgi:hypothetical protein